MLAMLKKILVAILILASGLNVQPAHAATQPPLLITEVQTGGTTTAQEFVELYNTTGSSLDVDGWQVQYLSSSGKTTTPLTTLHGTINANSYVLLSYKGYLPADATFSDSGSGVLASNAGHVQVVNAAGTQLDCIAWGDATQMAGCDQTSAPPEGSSIQRPQTGGAYDKSAGAAVVSPPTPRGGGLVEPAPEDPPTPPGNDPAPPKTYPTVDITELLPNPASPKTDTDDEFIELYNPHDETVNLAGYVLETGADSSHHFTLPAYSLAGHHYLALYSSETKLTLSNTSSKARLVTPDGTTVSDTPSYTAIGEGQAWEISGGTWHVSTTPTPGAANRTTSPTPGKGGGPQPSGLAACPAGKYRNPATNRCKTLAATASTLKACAPDQTRNAATNRCKKASLATSNLTPCQAGQTRNPATNRCRSAATASATLTPCKAGQERNPATNRCRNIGASTSSLVPCKPGYERNPATHRCRKDKSAVASNAATTSKESDSSHHLNVKIIVALATAAAGYAAYEYRNDLRLLGARLQKKIKTQ